MSNLAEISEADLKAELNRRQKHDVENYTFKYEWGYHGSKDASRDYRCVEVPQIHQVIYTRKKGDEWGEGSASFIVENDDQGFDTFGEAMERLQFLQELKEKKISSNLNHRGNRCSDMAAYYNEWEPYAAQWLRNLIAAGHIAPGDVDERSIVDVRPDDIRGYEQCHFFAGIGGWSLALRMAGWDDTRPVWTGSCPCQPFSVAGKQKAQSDDRHLWPVWFNLIKECRPAIVFGEQVAGAITHGWLDDAFDDLEREGYQTGAAVLPACSVGRPHKRDRLWFVADSTDRVYEAERTQCNVGGYENGLPENTDTVLMVDPISKRGCGGIGERQYADDVNASSEGRFPVGNAERAGLEGQPDDVKIGAGRQDKDGSVAAPDTHEWLECPDGKRRPVKPGVRLLAHGVSRRANKLRALGNAIVPQVAAEFIKATGLI